MVVRLSVVLVEDVRGYVGVKEWAGMLAGNWGVNRV